MEFPQELIYLSREQIYLVRTLRCLTSRALHDRLKSFLKYIALIFMKQKYLQMFCTLFLQVSAHLLFVQTMYTLMVPMYQICTIWQYGLWSFKTRKTKLERVLPKNQHTQRKLLNFEFWIYGELLKIIQIFLIFFY